MLNKLTTGTITKAIAAKPEAGAKRHFDGGGLYLEIKPQGAPHWYLKYKFAGRERRLAFGAYPSPTGLADARQLRDDAVKLLALGRDPGELRKAVKEAAKAPQPEPEKPTFGRFAADVLADLRAVQAPATQKKWKLHMGYATREFGHRAIDEIKTGEIVEFLRPFQASTRTTTMHSIKQKMSDVFRRGITYEACAIDPTQQIEKKVLLPIVSTPHKAVLIPARFGEILRKIDGYTGHPSTRGALLLLALTFQRPHMIRHMEWSEIDLENRRWEVAARDMKGRVEHKRDHVVPLSAPAMDILRAMLPISGDGHYVFPGRFGDKPMSDMTMNKALRDLGIEDHVGHGFRASANTMIKEQLAEALAPHIPVGAGIALQELIDLQLAHLVGDKTQRSYNRVKFIEFRKRMMIEWGTFINGLRQRQSKVQPLRARAG